MSSSTASAWSSPIFPGAPVLTNVSTGAEEGAMRGAGRTKRGSTAWVDGTCRADEALVVEGQI